MSDLESVVEFLNFNFNDLPPEPPELDRVRHRPVINLFQGLESEDFWQGKTVPIESGTTGFALSLPACKWMPEWIQRLRDFRRELTCALVPLIASNLYREYYKSGEVGFTEVVNPTELDWHLWWNLVVRARLDLCRQIKEARLEYEPILLSGEPFVSQRIGKIDGESGNLVWGREKRVVNENLRILGPGRKKTRLPFMDVIYKEVSTNLRTPEQQILRPIVGGLESGEFGRLKFCSCGRFYL